MTKWITDNVWSHTFLLGHETITTIKKMNKWTSPSLKTDNFVLQTRLISYIFLLNLIIASISDFLKWRLELTLFCWEYFFSLGIPWFSAPAILVCLSSVSEERKMILWPLNHPSKCLGKKKPTTEKMRREKRSVDIVAIQQREVWESLLSFLPCDSHSSLFLLSWSAFFSVYLKVKMNGNVSHKHKLTVDFGISFFLFLICVRFLLFPFTLFRSHLSVYTIALI